MSKGYREEYSFDQEAIIRFLQAVDNHLDAKGQLQIIGGAAIALVYAPGHQTTDLDYIQAEPYAMVTEALKAAKKIVPIPSEVVGIYCASFSFEDRLQELEIPGLTKLRIFVPDRHDIAVMKLSRGAERDFQAIEDMNACQPLKPLELIENYEDAIIQGASAQRQADINLNELLLILYGATEAEAGMTLLAELRARRPKY